MYLEVPYNSMLDYVNKIARQGGMAMSTGFVVDFTFQKASGYKSVLDQLLPGSDVYTMFCDEVNLPPSQAATGQVTGIHLGEGQRSYPHTKMYTDISMGWMCDANMEPYKFVQAWWQYIFQEYDHASGSEISTLDGQQFGASLGQMLSSAEKPSNRMTRLRYPEDYYCTIRIAKAERGPNGDADRVSLVHILQDAFPYTVDAVPLSFGQSQLTKCTANFYYSKHRVVYNDNRNVGAPSNSLNNLLSQNFVGPGGNLQLGSQTIT